jgi:hypothetical protein
LVFCTREEYANGAKLSTKTQPHAYVHRLQPDGTYRPWTEFPPAKITPISRTAKQAAKSHTTPTGKRVFRYSETERVVRFDNADGSRTIYPQHWNGAEWLKCYAPAATRVYHRDLIEGDLPGGHPLVYLVEGEPCADALVERGLVAVTWSGGTGQVRQAIDQLRLALTGAHVVLLPDADGVGRSAIREIALSLRGNAASVRFLDLYPDEESGKDIEDYFADGGTLEDLARRVEETQTYEPDAPADVGQNAWARLLAKAINLADVVTGGIKRPEYLIPREPLLLRGRVHNLFGGPEQGKTLVLQHLVLRAVRAGLRVLFIDEEAGMHETAERLDAMGATLDELARITYLPYALPGLTRDEQAAALLAAVQHHGYDLIAVDSLSKLLAAAGIEENDNTGCTQYMASWITPAAHMHGATVVLLDHTGKVDDDGSYARGASSKLADVDVQWHIKAPVRPSRESMGRIVVTRKKDRTSTVPATVKYIVGGDGTGAIRFGLEDTSHTPQIVVKDTDRPYLQALAAGGNIGKTWAEWRTATDKAESTFNDAVKRLRNMGAVTKQGELWSVAPGVIAPEDPPPSDAKQPTPVNYETTTAVVRRSDPDHYGGTTTPPLGGGSHRSEGAAGDEESVNEGGTTVPERPENRAAGVRYHTLATPPNAPADMSTTRSDVSTAQSPQAWVADYALPAVKRWAANAAHEKTVPLAVQRFAKQHGLDYDSFNRRTFADLGAAILAALDEEV